MSRGFGAGIWSAQNVTPRRVYRAALYTLLSGMVCLGSVAAAHAAAGPGGVVTGVLNYPDFKSGPTGILFDVNDPTLTPPYPIVDDAVHTPGIPGVRVYLKNVVTNQVTGILRTDSIGGFVFPSQPVGTYVLCWQKGLPGIAPGCTTDTFEVIDQVSNRWVENLGAGSLIDWTPLDSDKLAFEGYVTVPGTTPYAPNLNPACANNDPYFGDDETATVSLFDSNHALVATATANRLGRYLLALPAPAGPASYTLKARCGLSTVSVPAALPASYAGGPERIFQMLTLRDNTPPKIQSLVAFRGIHKVAGAPPGATVLARVVATDQENDDLQIRWQATAGIVVPWGPLAFWTLPFKGRGLHFLYVDVTDKRGGHTIDRIAISTDDGLVTAAPPSPPPIEPAGFLPESDRFLTYRGIDTKKSACQYYMAIGAVQFCTGDGTPFGAITFDQWRAKFGFSTDLAHPAPGELHAQFRNVGDLNLVRNHRAIKAGPEAIAYYVCNHAKASGAIPDSNLVACVAMEYSPTPGQNGGEPFTKFLTFGPNGRLYLSVNLDGRGEKFTPGNCVPCHGGDNYFQHFPESGAGTHDGNIGAYFLPFDLDNFEFAATPGLTRADQEDQVRRLNLLLMEPGDSEMLTTPGMELINGWYPGGAGLQQTEFVPDGWQSALDVRLPSVARGDSFDADELYLKVVKPSCRGCHITMGPKLGLDFHRYEDDPLYDANPDVEQPPGARPGDFVGGHAAIPRTQLNDSHTEDVLCDKYSDGLPTYNWMEDLNSPARTMPNAVQTFNRFWNDAVQVDLMDKYFAFQVHRDTPCDVPGL